jgi:hypothetical protein
MKTVYEIAMDRLTKIESLMPVMKDIIVAAEKAEFKNVSYNPYANEWGAIEFDISDISELPIVQAIITSVIPEYRYKHQTSWGAGGERLVAEWNDWSYPHAIIRLEATVETWPKELTKGDGCKWVQQETTEKQYRLVCDV